VAEKEVVEASMEMDREVIRCQICGLVQYRTRTGNCRRCLRLLPPKVTFVIPTPSPQDLPGDDRQLFENWPNRDTVENIGQRIRQLRESRGMTQSQLQARSRVSRSYLSRIESGQMTPSLGTLEKIAEALGVGRIAFLFRRQTEKRCSKILSSRGFGRFCGSWIGPSGKGFSRGCRLSAITSIRIRCDRCHRKPPRECRATFRGASRPAHRILQLPSTVSHSLAAQKNRKAQENTGPFSHIVAC